MMTASDLTRDPDRQQHNFNRDQPQVLPQPFQSAEIGYGNLTVTQRGAGFLLSGARISAPRDFSGVFTRNGR